MIVAVVLGGGACRSQNTAEEQKKVDELQRQLDEAKQQLAAKEEQIQARAAEALPPAEQDVPGAAATSPAAGSPSARSARKVTAQQGRAAADGSGAKPDTMDPADGQRGVDARQSEADARLQRELDSPKPVEYTIPAGTVIPVRATRELSTSQLATGATFTAVLERDLRVGGTVLAAQGAQVAGVVLSSDRGGRVKGLASLEVTIKSIAGRKGQTIRVKADDYGVVAGKTTGRDMTRTGIMTGAGAVVGAIAGGAKGAAIGAGTGAAAGVGTNMATRGKAAVIPAETLMEFRLTAPSTVVYER
jgi:hypothetical protein